MPRFVSRSLAAAGLFAASLAGTPAEAGMTLEEFRNYAGMQGGGPLIRSYLSGLRDGIIGLQKTLAASDVAPTICPEGDELTRGNSFEQTVLNEINNPSSGERWAGDTQLSTVVAVALQQAYPCETF